jgi:hypothetical protein
VRCRVEIPACRQSAMPVRLAKMPPSWSTNRALRCGHGWSTNS